MPIMFNQRSSMLNNFPKFMVEASKLCKPGPQASIFQHSNESEAGPEGGIRMPIMFIQRAIMLTTSPKFLVEASKLCKPGPLASIFQHSHESEAGPESGI